ncbi:receptor activity-modifying protein 1 [Stegastes partitus]|uniref:Receptor activity-modifying protein 1-like n=1 Tax=Stegastes partitus TaxID=144197 RepID=A0A3B4ZZT3_9TELE|nr:PREDICTED: receptor activity-modifying protein 1-like [Stegastes partitus]XP_008293617.1 PREDICTED: receptor activity-modifying protein 1-like [Stegastes partitus]
MILYLPFAALILVSRVACDASGIVDLQALNVTERNQTFTLSQDVNNTTKPNNATSSLFADNKTRIEDELERNGTSAITEEDEGFQEQENEFPSRHCDQYQLVHFSHNYCGENFHQEMKAISSEEWCILENVISPYNDLTVCLEHVSFLVGCYFPNRDIQDFFLYIHSSYFQNCSRGGGGGGEEFPEDAPHGLVVVLTVVPVSFVPVLVYLLVWKSKGRV